MIFPEVFIAKLFITKIERTGLIEVYGLLQYLYGLFEFYAEDTIFSNHPVKNSTNFCHPSKGWEFRSDKY